MKRKFQGGLLTQSYIGTCSSMFTHPDTGAIAATVGAGGGGRYLPLELVADFRAVPVVLVFQAQDVKAISSWRLPHRFQSKAWESGPHMTGGEALKNDDVKPRDVEKVKSTERLSPKATGSRQSQSKAGHLG